MDRQERSWKTIFSILWRTQRHVIVIVLTIISAVILLMLALTYHGDRQIKKHPVQHVEEKILEDQVLEDKAIKLASYFDCVTCHICQNMSLETCSCAYAVETRNLIRERILANIGENDIVKSLNEQFGGLKDKSLLNSDSSRTFDN